MINKNEETILGFLYFFHTEKAILVVWQSAIVEQKLLKWLTQNVIKIDKF